MVVNTLKKVTMPEKGPVKARPETPVAPTLAKKRLLKKEKVPDKLAATTVKSRVSAKNKKAIEQEYQEKIQQAIKELPKETEPAIKVEPAAKPETPVKAKEKPLVSKPMVEAQPVDLDTSAIRQAVLDELKSSGSTVILKKEKKSVIPPASVKVDEPVAARASEKRSASAKAEPVEKDIETPSKIHIHLGGKRIASIHHPKILIKPLSSLLVSLVLIAIVSLAGVYLGGWSNPLLIKVYGALNLPALFVDGQMVSLDAFYEDTRAFLAYQSRVGVSLSELPAKEQVLKSLVEKGVIASLAKQKGLNVSNAEVEQELNYIIASTGSQEELARMIKELYGWDLQRYTEKIIRPLLLAQKVVADFNLTGNNAEIKKNLQEKRQQALDGQADFSELAGQVNEDDSKFFKGDLGWFKLGDISPQFEIQFLNLEAGQLSPVFESSAGYHVVKLVEKSADQSGQFSYHLNQLFLKKNSFEDYLSGQIKKAKVLTLLKI